MTKKLHHARPWMTVMASILAILLIIKIGMDYWPEIKLLINPTPTHRVLLTRLIREHGLKDLLLLTVVIATLNAIPGMSIAAACILAGICYGPWLGIIVSWTGNILGNVLVATLFGHFKLFQLPAKAKNHRWLNKLLHQPHPRLGLIIGYMIPAIPNAVVNYSSVCLKVPLIKTIPLIAIGMLPCSIIYAFGGNALFHENLPQLLIFAILIIILITISLIIGRRKHVQNVVNNESNN